jgi:hypothetical protein
VGHVPPRYRSGLNETLAIMVQTSLNYIVVPLKPPSLSCKLASYLATEKTPFALYHHEVRSCLDGLDGSRVLVAIYQRSGIVRSGALPATYRQLYTDNSVLLI